MFNTGPAVEIQLLPAGMYHVCEQLSELGMAFGAGFQEQNASLGSGELQALAGGNFELSTSPDSQGTALGAVPPLPCLGLLALLSSCPSYIQFPGTVCHPCSVDPHPLGPQCFHLNCLSSATVQPCFRPKPCLCMSSFMCCTLLFPLPMQGTLGLCYRYVAT